VDPGHCRPSRHPVVGPCAWRINLCTPGGIARALVSAGLALDIGALLVNLHLVNDRGLGPFAAALIELLDVLERDPLQLSVENMPDTDPAEVNELFERLANLRPSVLSRVGMCLDLGHANLAAATRNDYLRFLDGLGPQVPIIHIHMHENYGDVDSHLPLFTGPAASDLKGLRGFVRRMRQRGFSGSIILEQWPNPPSLLNRARQGLLEMFAATAFEAGPADAGSRFPVGRAS
jgi:sugar phosphate isomerase/epimerase